MKMCEAYFGFSVYSHQDFHYAHILIFWEHVLTQGGITGIFVSLFFSVFLKLIYITLQLENKFIKYMLSIYLWLL